VLLSLCLATFPSAALSAATIYDLKTNWSDTNNPNGVWAYRQGASILPHQSDLTVCCGSSFGITGGWAPGSQGGNFLPMWVQTTGDNPNPLNWLAGDIVLHSVDGFNGNPALGEANVTWTAPMAGTIDISVGIWYAQSGFGRSNDVTLMLGATTLDSGTVSEANGKNRANPLTFGAAGLNVNPGDVLTLQVQRSPGQGAGSFAGVNLTIAETSKGPVMVSIDIKPGGFPNSINPRSRGKIPVAVLSDLGFSAPTHVDPASLTFGRTGDEQSLAFCNLNGEDVNGDGLLDLVCHFDTGKTGFQPGDTQGVLKGRTFGGIPFLGVDTVKIVP